MRAKTSAILLGSALAFGAMLGGCSDVYFDRRDSVTFHVGDAVEANKVAHIIDPWPPGSADRNIESDGQRQQRAMERYRTNKITPLQPMSTSSVGYSQPSGGDSGGQGQP
jgi:hypothetical protein